MSWVPDEEWLAAAAAASDADAAEKAAKERRRVRYGRASMVLFWPGLALTTGGFVFGFILLVVMLGATALGHETPEFLRAYSVAMLALLFGYPMLKLSVWAGKKAKK